MYKHLIRRSHDAKSRPTFTEVVDELIAIEQTLPAESDVRFLSVPMCMYMYIYLYTYCVGHIILRGHKKDINGHFVQFSVRVNLKMDLSAAN